MTDQPDPTADLLEVARDAASDLRRWARAFSGLTGYASDFEGTAQRPDDAIKAAEKAAAGKE